MIDGGMQRVADPTAMMADLRKRTEHLMADFMKRVPSSQAPIKAYLAEMKRGMMHGRASPNAGAPPLLRPLLDGIDVLSRLDGWLGAAVPGEPDGPDARRSGGPRPVEHLSLGAGRHPGRLGIQLLPDGGVLHLRRGDDACGPAAISG